jgi:aspartate/methionine/tyrosine aminotransferase
MVAVNYPNNPSGSMLSPSVLHRLRYMAGPGVTLFNDATYGPLVYNAEPRSLLGAEFPADAMPELVELHSFSKLYPIGPLAVSFLAGSASLVQMMATYSEFAWSPLSRLQLGATAKCLQDRDRIQRFLDYFPRQLEALRATLTGIGFRPHRAHSGAYLVCDVPDAIAGSKVSSAQGAAKLLMSKYDVAVVPLDTSGRSYLRFTALYRPHDLEKLAQLGSRLRLN